MNKIQNIVNIMSDLDQPQKASRSSISSWEAWFEQASQVFDDPRMKIAYYKDGQTGEPYSEETVRLTHQDIFQKLAPRKTDVVLDVGCGVGYFTKFYAASVKRIVGIDVAPHMVQTAYSMNPDGLFVASKADCLPFRARSFNCIFSYGVTQYLANQATAEKMLDEMRCLLKSDGRIFVGDILEPVHEPQSKSYNKATVRGEPWWPKSLDHNLAKLYISKNFFLEYCQRHGFACEFFTQNIPGRSIPTPRYDVLITTP